MIRKRNFYIFISIFFDAIAASITWFLFFYFRKAYIEADIFGQKNIEFNVVFYKGLFYVTLFWVFIYFLAGNYKQIWRKSRIKEFSKTFSITIIGVLLLFFALLLDDTINGYKTYYLSLLVLFVIHFSLTATERLVIASVIIKKLRKKELGFNTVVIGNNQRTLDLIQELNDKNNAQGFLIKGFVNNSLSSSLPHILENTVNFLGHYEILPEIIKKHKIDEIIIGIESNNHIEINQITDILEDETVSIKIIPDTYDIRTGIVKLENVVGTALIEINKETLPQWQKITKRTIDIVVSLLVLFLLSPVYFLVALGVKFTSPGSIFFKQIRIGLKGKPFYIYKFRSMYIDSEKNGPALSNDNDDRRTKFGVFIRKYRLDEIPQFYNVLIGNMSLVGPRPERKFYIEQIVKVAPHYKHLLRVKPGITSWGMVKYGYAENIEEMVERLKFDILYIENQSIAVDFRILIYTILIIIQGRGK